MFKTVCDAYNLIPDDNYTIPPEAEGLESSSPNDPANEGGEGENARSSGRVGQGAKPVGIMKREGSQDTSDRERDFDGEDAGLKGDSGATARRHRHAPSRSGTAPATVVEESEDEDPSAAKERAAAASDEHKPLHRFSESVIIAKPEDHSTTATTAAEQDTPAAEQQPEVKSEDLHMPLDSPPTIEVEIDQENTPEPWKTADPDAASAIGAPSTEDTASSIFDVDLAAEAAESPSSPPPPPPKDEEKDETGKLLVEG